MAKDPDYIEPEKLVIIGLDTNDDASHPLYDERVEMEVSENLVKNIIYRGVQLPVLVREQDGQKLVVDGRQRVRAAREARKRQGEQGAEQLLVPVRYIRSDDASLAGLMVALNELRENDEILVKARKAARLLDYGKDINEVALDFGRTPTTVRNWLRLLEADPSVHVAIQMGEISSAAGIEVASYPRDQQKGVLDRLLRSNGRNARTDVLPPEPGEGPESADGQNASGTPTTPPATPPVSEAAVKREKRKAKGPSLQKGVRRVWLRKALKTKAAEKLPAEKLAVLQWMATGEAQKGDWFDDFYFEASSEIGE